MKKSRSSFLILSSLFLSPLPFLAAISCSSSANNSQENDPFQEQLNQGWKLVFKNNEMTNDLDFAKLSALVKNASAQEIVKIFEDRFQLLIKEAHGDHYHYEALKMPKNWSIVWNLDHEKQTLHLDFHKDQQSMHQESVDLKALFAARFSKQSLDAYLHQLLHNENSKKENQILVTLNNDGTNSHYSLQEITNFFSDPSKISEHRAKFLEVFSLVQNKLHDDHYHQVSLNLPLNFDLELKASKKDNHFKIYLKQNGVKKLLTEVDFSKLFATENFTLSEYIKELRDNKGTDLKNEIMLEFKPNLDHAAYPLAKIQEIINTSTNQHQALAQIFNFKVKKLHIDHYHYEPLNLKANIKMVFEANTNSQYDLYFKSADQKLLVQTIDIAKLYDNEADQRLLSQWFNDNRQGMQIVFKEGAEVLTWEEFRHLINTNSHYADDRAFFQQHLQLIKIQNQGREILDFPEGAKIVIEDRNLGNHDLVQIIVFKNDASLRRDQALAFHYHQHFNAYLNSLEQSQISQLSMERFSNLLKDRIEIVPKEILSSMTDRETILRALKAITNLDNNQRLLDLEKYFSFKLRKANQNLMTLNLRNANFEIGWTYDAINQAFNLVMVKQEVTKKLLTFSLETHFPELFAANEVVKAERQNQEFINQYQNKVIFKTISERAFATLEDLKAAIKTLVKITNRQARRLAFTNILTAHYYEPNGTLSALEFPQNLYDYEFNYNEAEATLNLALILKRGVQLKNKKTYQFKKINLQNLLNSQASPTSEAIKSLSLKAFSETYKDSLFLELKEAISHWTEATLKEAIDKIAKMKGFVKQLAEFKKIFKFKVQKENQTYQGLPQKTHGLVLWKNKYSAQANDYGYLVTLTLVNSLSDKNVTLGEDESAKIYIVGQIKFNDLWSELNANNNYRIKPR